MEDDDSGWRLASSGVMALEVFRRWSGHDQSVAVRVSIPGREGHLERSWQVTGGRLDGAQAVDLTHWVVMTVRNALERSTGVQGLLLQE